MGGHQDTGVTGALGVTRAQGGLRCWPRWQRVLPRTASGGGQRESSWDAPAPVGHPRFMPDPTELAERPHCLGTWGQPGGDEVPGAGACGFPLKPPQVGNGHEKGREWARRGQGEGPARAATDPQGLGFGGRRAAVVVPCVPPLPRRGAVPPCPCSAALLLPNDDESIYTEALQMCVRDACISINAL